MKNSKIKSDFELDGKSADAVLVGGGPVSFGVLVALQKELGNKSKFILLERNNRFEGNGWASVKHFRTYQTHGELSLAVQDTVDWYNSLPHKKDEVIVYRFPYIFVAKSRQQLDTFAKNLATVKKYGFGKNAGIITMDGLAKKFPFIKPVKQLTGALIYPEAGWLNLTFGINYIIESSKKTDFYLNTSMEKIIVKNGKIQGIKTSKGFIKTDTVVLSPGQFVLEAIGSIEGAEFSSKVPLEKVIRFQKRQSFEGKIHSLPANVRLFLIAENGAYVRIVTDQNGRGNAAYGFADPTVPFEKNPVLNPKHDGMKFAKSVYKSLATLIPQYKKEFAIKPTNSRAGYYVETPDHLPVISATNIKGLFLCAGMSHLGVMSSIGHGKRIVQLMKGKIKNNPFDVNRSFQLGEGSVL